MAFSAFGKIVNLMGIFFSSVCLFVWFSFSGGGREYQSSEKLKHLFNKPLVCEGI